MPGQYEPEPAGQTRPARRGWWVAAAVVVLLLIAVAAGLVQRSSAPPPATPAPAPQGSALSPLPTGSVVLGGGGTGSVHGVPTGFAPTPEGGVAAAVNDAALAHANPRLLQDDQRHAIETALYSPTYRGKRIDDTTAPALRAQMGLNEAAQPRDPATGGIDWSQQVRMQCLAQYGAYRVDEATPTHAAASVWMPCVFGITPGSSAAGANIVWTTAKSTVDNENGQWRWTQFQDLPGPQPANPSTPVVSLRERARLLGPGWALPVGATDQPGWEKQ